MRTYVIIPQEVKPVNFFRALTIPVRLNVTYTCMHAHKCCLSSLSYIRRKLLFKCTISCPNLTSVVRKPPYSGHVVPMCLSCTLCWSIPALWSCDLREGGAPYGLVFWCMWGCGDHVISVVGWGLVLVKSVGVHVGQLGVCWLIMWRGADHVTIVLIIRVWWSTLWLCSSTSWSATPSSTGSLSMSKPHVSNIRTPKWDL